MTKDPEMEKKTAPHIMDAFHLCLMSLNCNHAHNVTTGISSTRCNIENDFLLSAALETVFNPEESGPSTWVSEIQVFLSFISQAREKACR